MKLIAAVDNNWAIGRDGKLLARLSQDMEYFKKMTLGHVVVMGRKTLESLPGKKPLPDRTNIVLTSDRDYQKDGIIAVHSETELMEQLKQYDPEGIFVIGGGSIYRLLLKRCDTACITHIDKYCPADTWFPDLDADREWTLTEKSDTCTENGTDFCFKTFKRRIYYEHEHMDNTWLRRGYNTDKPDHGSECMESLPQTQQRHG